MALKPTSTKVIFGYKLLVRVELVKKDAKNNSVA